MNTNILLNTIYSEIYDLLSQAVLLNVASGGDCVLWADEYTTVHEALIELAARHGCEGPLKAQLERDCGFTNETVIERG